MSFDIGPLPVVDAGDTAFICLLPGDIRRPVTSPLRVERERGRLRLRSGDVALIVPLEAEAALRTAPRTLLVEGEEETARVLTEVTFVWDL